MLPDRWKLQARLPWRVKQGAGLMHEQKEALDRQSQGICPSDRQVRYMSWRCHLDQLNSTDQRSSQLDPVGAPQLLK